MEEGLSNERFNPGFNPSTDGKSYAEVAKSAAKKELWVKICVTGYDTSLPHTDISKALSDHFKSCGQISSLAIQKNSSRAFIIALAGDGGEDKALQLNGSNLRGWNLTVKVFSTTEPPTTELTPKQLALIKERQYDKTFWYGIAIMRYQIMQSESDLKKALRHDFSSCGEITDVITPRNSQGGPCPDNTNFVYFDGEEAVNKAVKHGRSLGLIVHILPKMSDNENSTMILPHCVQIAHEIFKLQMESIFSLNELVSD